MPPSLFIIAQQLIRVSNEPAVHVRTRAMKALSTIIAADPGILSRVSTALSLLDSSIIPDVYTA